MRPRVTVHYSLQNLTHAHPGAMTKPTKRKRSESEGAGGRIVLFEVTLRGAAIKCAAVAKLDPSHPDWRRGWRDLRRAAIRMVAKLEAAGQPVGHLPLRALMSGNPRLR
jgi:hypothetical protein